MEQAQSGRYCVSSWSSSATVPCATNCKPWPLRSCTIFLYQGRKGGPLCALGCNAPNCSVFPSIVARSGDAEGFGIVFIEAQAMGTPVVSFATGGVPEAVEHGNTGFLAKERDWRQLAVHIVDLFKNDSLRVEMSRAGIERVRRSFSLDRQCALLEDLYSRSIGLFRNSN